MLFTSPLITADIPTINGRIYPKPELQNAVALFQTKIQEKTAFVTFGEINFSEKTLPEEMICGVVNSLELTEDNQLRANIDFLETPNGLQAQENYQNYDFGPVSYAIFQEPSVIMDLSFLYFHFFNKE